MVSSCDFILMKKRQVLLCFLNTAIVIGFSCDRPQMIITKGWVVYITIIIQVSLVVKAHRTYLSILKKATPFGELL